MVDSSFVLTHVGTRRHILLSIYFVNIIVTLAMHTLFIFRRSNLLYWPNVINNNAVFHFDHFDTCKRKERVKSVKQK